LCNLKSILSLWRDHIDLELLGAGESIEIAELDSCDVGRRCAFERIRVVELEMTLFLLGTLRRLALLILLSGVIMFPSLDFNLSLRDTAASRGRKLEERQRRRQLPLSSL